jgi:hypothetical protein
LLRKPFGFEVLQCTSCHVTMLAIAVITQRAVIDKILGHVGLSLSAQLTVDSYSVRYEVSGESIPPWAVRWEARRRRALCAASAISRIPRRSTGRAPAKRAARAQERSRA